MNHHQEHFICVVATSVHQHERRAAKTNELILLIEEEKYIASSFVGNWRSLPREASRLWFVSKVANNILGNTDEFFWMLRKQTMNDWPNYFHSFRFHCSTQHRYNLIIRIDKSCDRQKENSQFKGNLKKKNHFDWTINIQNKIYPFACEEKATEQSSAGVL